MATSTCSAIENPLIVVETSRLCGLDPREYLCRAIRVAIEKSGEVYLHADGGG